MNYNDYIRPIVEKFLAEQGLPKFDDMAKIIHAALATVVIRKKK